MSDQTRTENAIELGKMYMLLDAANKREVALRDELDALRESYESMRDRKNSIVDLQQRLTVAEQRACELEQDKRRLDLWQSRPVYFGGFAPSGSWSFFNQEGRTCYGKNLRDALDQLGVMDVDLAALKPAEEGEGS